MTDAPVSAAAATAEATLADFTAIVAAARAHNATTLTHVVDRAHRTTRRPRAINHRTARASSSPWVDANLDAVPGLRNLVATLHRIDTTLRAAHAQADPIWRDAVKRAVPGRTVGDGPDAIRGPAH